MRSLTVVGPLFVVIAIWISLEVVPVQSASDSEDLNSNNNDAISSGENNFGVDDGNSVTELTDSNFKELVMQSEDGWLIKFFAPWCYYSKKLEPEFIEAAKAEKGKIKFGSLDAIKHESMANEYDIRGYPTILYFPAGKKSDPETYDGERTAESIIDFVDTL